MQQRAGEATEIDLGHMNLGTGRVDVLLATVRLTFVDDIAIFKRLGERVAFVDGPAFPPEAGFAAVVEVIGRDRDEPRQAGLW
jgi:hypothetical protein